MKAIFTVLLTALLMTSSGLVSAQERLSGPQKDAVAWIDENSAAIEDAARFVFDHPETALREHQSAEYLATMLEHGGFKVERGVAGMPTAFVATFGEGSPLIGVLAEYDALPGLSQKASMALEDPVLPGDGGHGCGHNLFGAGSIAAALSMKEVMERHGIGGTVKVFGCPAEETVTGKVYMARDGVFDGLDACLNWHPSGSNKVSLQKSRAMNNFEVEFRGKTAHASGDPWSGRSALDAVELMNAGVNFLREHIKESVRIHYSIPDGGMAPNIVPGYAKVWYFVRDAERSGVDEVYQRVLDCAKGAALMTGTTMEVNLITGVYSYLPNHTVSAVVDKNLRLIGPPEFTPEEEAFAKEMQKNLGIEQKGMNSGIESFEEPARISGGSTDAANVSWIVPTSGELHVVTTPSDIPWHSWAVTSCSASSIGYKGMITAAKVLAASGIELLMDSGLIEEAQKEFDEKTEGFTYISPLPEGQRPPLPEE